MTPSQQSRASTQTAQAAVVHPVLIGHFQRQSMDKQSGLESSGVYRNPTVKELTKF